MNIDKEREALRRLVDAAEAALQNGAATERQWVELGNALESARAALDEQKAGPSDNQILFEWAKIKNTGDMRVDLVAFARALLSKYAAPVNEQDARDASRYRAFRAAMAKSDFGFFLKIEEALKLIGVPENLAPNEEQIDVAFDAAIAQQGNGEGSE